MECKFPERRPIEQESAILLDYGLGGLTPGQKKFEFLRATETLQHVMMDRDAPEVMKQLIRQQNAVGLLVLEHLLAVHVRRQEEE